MVKLILKVLKLIFSGFCASGRYWILHKKKAWTIPPNLCLITIYLHIYILPLFNKSRNMVFYGKNPLLMANPIRLAEMLCFSDGNEFAMNKSLSMAKNRVLAQFKSGQNMSSNFALKFLQEGVILEQVRILWQTKKKTSGIQNRCQN